MPWVEAMRTAWTFRCFAITALLAGCPNDDDPSGDEDTNVSATEPGTSTTNPSSSSGNNESSDSSSTTEAEEEESGSSSGTPSDACGEGRVCLGPPPLGWAGPVVIAKGDVAEALPDCTDPYPGNDITRLEGFVEPEEAECTCSCSLNDGGCYMYTYNSTEANPTYCSQYGSPMGQGCFQLPTPITDGMLQVYSYPSFGAATCDQQASETIPEIPWAAVVKGCTGSYSDEACDATDGICYNKPNEGFEQQICYVAQGEVPLCPPGTDFQERTIRYSAVQDDRDCTSCQCGQLNYCLDEYEYFTNNDCSGAAAGTVPNGTCQSGVTAQAVNFDFTGVSCPIQSMAEPEGEATPLDPWTYCCTEPF
jgi:hypothetical protein